MSAALSIIIPVYNEFSTVSDVVRSVRERGPAGAELIVVDDCSSDGTRTVLQEELSGLIDKIVLHEVNQGKGAALRSGIGVATGEFVVFQDADLEYDPGELGAMLEIVQSGKADAVYGSRFLHPKTKEICPLWHRAVNRGLTEFSNLFTGFRLTDMETCYKLLPLSFMKSIEMEENRFGIEPEITAKAADHGLRVEEIPIAYNRREFDEGKKIGPIDGFRALYVITKYGLLYI
ncbi:glycosyltransferase family 2 protein [Pelagicoccus sp. NFK12]|uniref:Glycosyltransferase family 2 protein n=1 Tax=Pelagicoccus enzymogenes TaxID=2773457 RepID=A0A927IGS9_9BACT|nr:glycosyltransferase family 2 protein [Pelagicoccus enzymogenes]MBD5778695.1 glycosyltransferase family 2 protein [Pelagicoccus enzymogenes]MDQ8197559.1 glycosyltransferase family 2 protein [Pelagicoccus enzymogenes]